MSNKPQNQKKSSQAVNDVEEQAPVEKRRGRGPCKIFFAAVGYNEDTEEVIKEEIECNSEQECTAAFEKKHGMEPMCVLGGPLGYYKKAMPQSAKKANPQAITVSGAELAKLRHTSDAWTGIYQGWEGNFNGIRAMTVAGHRYEENELVKPFILKPVNPDAKLPKPRIGNSTLIRFEDIESPVEVQDE